MFISRQPLRRGPLASSWRDTTGSAENSYSRNRA